MKKRNDLTQGDILKTLVTLSLPIMAQSFIQMAYNMIDMMWLGRVGSKSVAAVGTAGFLIWFSFSLIIIAKVGVEVGVSQSLGKKEPLLARDFARNGLQLTIFMGILYTIVLMLFSKNLIGFFNLNDTEVINQSLGYLKIIAVGMVFTFINPVLSGIYNGMGNSKTPFYINSVGLVVNIILDPILIFKYNMGAEGAAYATVISQAIVTVIFVVLFRSSYAPFKEFHFFKMPIFNVIKQIFKFGSPIGLQSGLFTVFASLLARLVAQWGPIPIAVQKVGSQIEAISWMTASGFSTALSSFVGQNYGAGKWDRIAKGYFITIMLSGIIGILASLLLIFFAEPLFRIFIPNDPEAIRIGVTYLQILGYSQLFMCLEITSQGAFNGIGKTLPPSIVSIIFTGLRVPMAMFLSSAALLGLSGVWWSISISSIIKGLIMASWFIYFIVRHPDVCVPKKAAQLIFRFDRKAWNDKRCLNGK